MMFPPRVLALLVSGFLGNCAGASLAYMPAVKHSRYYFLVGMALSNLTLFLYGTIWDGLIMAAYFIVPILLFGVRLNLQGAIGLALVVGGTLILKLS